MSDAHLTEGVLRAYLDAELRPLASLRCVWHLRRCEPCRAALEEERALGRRTSGLLAAAASPVDVEDGWQRFTALSVGLRAGSPPPMRSRDMRPVLAVFAVVTAALALPVAWTIWGSGHELDLRGATQAKDACCWDLDGGGRGDDGVFTLSRGGEVVECVVLYDDVDGSGTLSPTDVIRYVSDRRVCGLSPSAKLPMPLSAEMLAATRALDPAPGS